MCHRWAAHQNVSQIKGPVDPVFLDADKEGYADYLKQLLLLLRCGDTVIGHSIEPGRADPACLQAISTNRELDAVFANFGSGGLSVTLKKR